MCCSIGTHGRNRVMRRRLEMTISRGIRRQRNLPPVCHPNREHAARGLCDYCYKKELGKENPEYWQRHVAAQRNRRRLWKAAHPVATKRRSARNSFLGMLRERGITEEQ